MPTESKGEESKILQHVEILGSVGEVRERDGKIFWFMNGTEKEPHETEPVLPIIESAVAKVIQAGKSGNIDHIRISPAVALHLIFEGVLDPEQIKNTPATDTTSICM